MDSEKKAHLSEFFKKVLKRILFILGIGLITVGATYCFRWSPPSAPNVLRVGITEWAGFGGGVLKNGGLAQGRLWNGDFTVEFVRVESFGDKIKKLACKDSQDCVDIMWSTVQSWAAEFQELKKANVDARAIMQLASSSESCAFLVDPRIEEIGGMPADSVVAPRYGPAHWLAETALDAKQIYPVESSEDAVAGFVGFKRDHQRIEGRVYDAVALCDPFLREAWQNRPTAKLIVLPEVEQANYIFVVRQDFLESKRAEVQAFVRLWLEGNTELRTRHDPLIKILVPIRLPSVESPPKRQAEGQQIAEELQKVRLATLEDNNRFLHREGGELPFDTQFRAAAERWNRDYQVDATDPYNAADDSILREIRPAAGFNAEFCRSASPRISARVDFNSGGSTILDTAVLDGIVTLLRREPGTQACVVGHSVANENPGLAEVRTQRIFNYLTRRSIDPARLFPVRLLNDNADVQYTVGSPNLQYAPPRVVNGQAEVFIVQGVEE